jgi:outer membrane cobalamin receptor
MPELEHTIGSFGDAGIRPERSRHLEAAVEHTWGAGLRWQVSAYHREERDILNLDGNDYIVVDGELLAPSMTPRWRNALSGAARGVEVLFQRRSASGMSGWISYAWSRTDYVDTAGGERFDGDFDQRHTFSAYGLYRLSPVTSINAKFRYGSNFPIPGYLVREQEAYYVGSARNTERLPSYARVDVRANRAFNFDRRRLTLFVEVVNLFGRTNHAADLPHVWRSGRVFSATQSLFPFLPTAGLQIDF